MSEKPKRRSESSRPIIIAAVVNIAFAVFVVFLAFQKIKVGKELLPRWEVFLQAQPNEIGDTLAGIFGSITLIWIVASVFQQSIELRAQRYEFEEISKSQAEQVKAMQAQAGIYEDERKRRDEMRGYGELIQLVRSLIDDYQEFSKDLGWSWLNEKGASKNSIPLPKISNNTDKNRRDENIEQLKIAIEALHELFSIFIHKSTLNELTERSSLPHSLVEFIDDLKQLSTLEPALSSASQIRVRRMGVSKAILVLDLAIKTTSVWRSP